MRGAGDGTTDKMSTVSCFARGIRLPENKICTLTKTGLTFFADLGNVSPLS